MVYQFQAEMSLPMRIEQVFEFFSDAGNLESITPPALQFHILTPRPISMQVGTLIDYELKLNGIKFHWRSLISRWEPPCCFVDEQIRGPYKSWHHTHSFREENGQTIISDTVRYQLPMGPLGFLVHPLVRRKIEGIFHYREKIIRKLLSESKG